MPAARTRFAFLRRWDQVLVLACVVVASDLASTWWLSHRGPPVPPTWAGKPQAIRAPDAAILDEEMATALKRAALAHGLSPTMLPEPARLWDLFAQQSPTATTVDIGDRRAVQAALTGFVGELAANERRGGTEGPGGGGPPGPPPGPGDKPPGDGPPPPPPASPGPDGKAEPARVPDAPAQALPSIGHIDEVRAERLSDLARARGVDPAQVLPSPALRQAAIESGDIRSAASQELLEAYRAAMTRLEDQASAP